jgi:hypothetical protein
MTGPSNPLPANNNPGFAPDFYRAFVYPAHPTNILSGTNTPLGFVMHTPEEPWDNNESTPVYFAGANRDASTHYYLDSDGDVYQLVDEQRPAIANGVLGRPHPVWANPGISLNRQTLSAEIEGFAASIQNTLIPGQPQFNSLVELVRNRCQVYGIPTDRAHVIGHYEVANNRSDPGAGFPWDALIAAINTMSKYAIRWTGNQQDFVLVIRHRVDNNLWARVHSNGAYQDWQQLPGGEVGGDPVLTANEAAVNVACRLPNGAIGIWAYYNDAWHFDGDVGGSVDPEEVAPKR